MAGSGRSRPSALGRSADQRSCRSNQTEKIPASVSAFPTGAAAQPESACSDQAVGKIGRSIQLS
jgi:hypothetical protein